VVNVKYRKLPKQFWSRPGGQKVLYGYDDVWPGPEPETSPIVDPGTGLPLNDTIVIVEGEMDKLALNQAGLWNVVSVPFGAPSKASAKQPSFEDFDPLRDKNFSYVWDCRELFDKGCRRVVIATDNDGPGYALREELARRLGRWAGGGRHSVAMVEFLTLGRQKGAAGRRGRPLPGPPLLPASRPPPPPHPVRNCQDSLERLREKLGQN
jgi:hypothetical protein